jgi:uncharacterized damage-inducible protein DinB
MTTMIELMLAEMDREMVGTRRALERVPEGQNEWKPHEKSMPMGYLAGLIATMPRWIVSIVVEDGLDLASPGQYRSRAFASTDELLGAFDSAVAAARRALLSTTDDRLLSSHWQLFMQGKALSRETRYEAIRVGVLNHLYHHRAQLSGYLRLNGKPVPALYGPSADETPY